MLNNIFLQIANNATNNGTLPQLPAITWQNAFGDVTSALILLTLMIAITVRTYPEYVEKVVKGEVTSFNPKYIATAIVSFVAALPIAMGLMPLGTEVFMVYFGDWGIVGSLLMVGIIGYGTNHGVNKGTSFIGHFFNPKTSNKSSTGEPSVNTETNKPVNPVS